MHATLIAAAHPRTRNETTTSGASTIAAKGAQKHASDPMNAVLLAERLITEHVSIAVKIQLTITWCGAQNNW